MDGQERGRHENVGEEQQVSEGSLRMIGDWLAISGVVALGAAVFCWVSNRLASCLRYTLPM